MNIQLILQGIGGLVLAGAIAGAWRAVVDPHGQAATGLPETGQDSSEGNT